MRINKLLLASLSLTGFTVLSGAVLSATTVSADDVIDQVSISVPVSCTIRGTGMTSHNTEIHNGNYTPNIGSTTLHAVCNDNEGFAIYAAGYTGDEIGEANSNKLVGSSVSGNATIESGLATSAGNPDVSNWAMKLAITQDSGDTTGTNAFVIDSAPNVSGGANASFSQYHVVPNEYTKVAHKNSSTDMTAETGGVKLTTTYAVYISKTQVADTYSGQVIYTLVHPSDHAKPVANPATLDTGRTVNAKLKSLAATIVNGEETTITPEFDPSGDYDYNWDYGDGSGFDSYIKTIDVHLNTAAPTDFIPSEKNTISSTTSKKPIYIVFDNTNDAGIMHFYTEGEKIFLPSDSSFMFYYFFSLSGISGISDWDTSNVTDMKNMFRFAGYNATTFALNLSSWDTFNVTDMSYMFSRSGNYATNWSIGDLSFWNTSNVTNMSGMFDVAGQSASVWSVGDLSSWDTSHVTNMRGMFATIGGEATTFALNISSWDTSSVTDMSYMFNDAGRFASDFSLDLSSWNTSSVTNMQSMFMNISHYASTSTLTLNISSWDTSSVTNMSRMFAYAGQNATTFNLNLSSWNTPNV